LQNKKNICQNLIDEKNLPIFFNIWLCLCTVTYSFVFLPPIFTSSNFSFGDFLVCIGFLAVGLYKKTRVNLTQFYKRGYLLLTLLTLVFASFSSLITDDVERNMLYLVQLSFIFVVLIPYFVVSINLSNLSIYFIEKWSLISVYLYFIGLIFYYYFNSNVLIYNSGVNRLISNLYFCGAMPISFAVLGIFFLKCHKFLFFFLIILLSVIAIFSSNRTDLVIIFMTLFLGFLFSRKTFTSVIIFLISSIIIAYMWFFSGMQEYLGLLVRESNIFSDSVRLSSITNAINRLSSNPLFIFIGQGWGSSGDGSESGLVVHNFVIQVLLEGGIGTLIFMTWVYLLPILYARKSGHSNNLVKMLVYLQTFSLIIFFSLNSISLERVYWISLAVLIGLGYRIKYNKNTLYFLKSRLS
jgi:hypothetical protein